MYLCVHFSGYLCLMFLDPICLRFVCFMSHFKAFDFADQIISGEGEIFFMNFSFYLSIPFFRISMGWFSFIFPPTNEILDFFFTALPGRCPEVAKHMVNKK